MRSYCRLCNRVHELPPPAPPTPTILEDAYGVPIGESFDNGTVRPMGTWDRMQSNRRLAFHEFCDRARATP